MDAKQKVWLEGGTARGQVTDDVDPGEPHLLHFEDDGDRWTEVYVLDPARSHPHDMYGDLPVMAFAEKREGGS